MNAGRNTYAYSSELITIRKANTNKQDCGGAGAEMPKGGSGKNGGERTKMKERTAMMDRWLKETHKDEPFHALQFQADSATATPACPLSVAQTSRS